MSYPINLPTPTGLAPLKVPAAKKQVAQHKEPTGPQERTGASTDGPRKTIAKVTGTPATAITLE